MPMVNVGFETNQWSDVDRFRQEDPKWKKVRYSKVLMAKIAR